VALIGGAIGSGLLIDHKFEW